MNRFHEFFDDYIANPLGEMTFAVGSLAVAGKGIYETVQVLTGEEQLDTGAVMESVGYGAGALALGMVAFTAARHYRGPYRHK